MNNRKIVFKKSWYGVFHDELSDKEAGVLFKAICKYQSNPTGYDVNEIYKESKSAPVRIAWHFLKNEIDEMMNEKKNEDTIH